jgi:putative DNA primase/helicase
MSAVMGSSDPYSGRRLQDLKPRLNGQWLNMLTHFCPQLQTAADRKGKHVPCPVHGGTDGFRFAKDAEDSGRGICNTCGGFADGFAILHWMTGWSYNVIFDEVARYLGLDVKGKAASPAPAMPAPAAPKQPVFDKFARENLVDTIGGGFDLRSPKSEPARLYLKQRGVLIAPLPSHEEVMFNPYTPRGNGRDLAIISLVRNVQDQVVTVHRTFINRKGEKSIGKDGECRMMMTPPLEGSVSGAAIRLYPATTTVGLGEGLETALAVRAAYGIPVWSTINSTLMKYVKLPEHIRTVYLFGDNDRKCAGQTAVAEAANRFEQEGRKVKIFIPTGEIPADQKSLDWNDVWLSEGQKGFPRLD